MPPSRARISCELYDKLTEELDLSVVSSCTDLGAEFHSAPQIDTVWGLNDTPVVESHRYPAWLKEGRPDPDRQPCDHWLLLRLPDVEA